MHTGDGDQVTTQRSIREPQGRLTYKDPTWGGQRGGQEGVVALVPPGHVKSQGKREEVGLSLDR